MSILMKKPRIEEIADALGDAKKTLLGVLDGPGEYARFDLEKGPLPVGGAPLVRRSILSYKGREYPGVYLRTTLGSHFIEVSGKEECAAYEVDEAHRSLRKVDEPLTAEELRRVLGGSSGGGSGIPDDYAQQLQSLIQFTGNKTEVGGDLEVDGNATFAGKNCFVWHGTLNEPVEGMTVTSNVSGFFFHGPITTFDGQAIGDPGILALTASLGDDGNEYYIINPQHIVDPATQETRPATVEEILSGNWSLMASIDSGTKLITENSEAQLKALNVDNLDVANTNNNPVISGLFKVSWEDITLQDIAKAAKKVNGKSDAKYQHTVHIITYSDNNAQLNVSFTAMSSKITPVISYQMLQENFGGCNLALSGLVKYQSALIPVYLDLHGGTIETDKIYAVDPSNPGAWRSQTLSTFPNITFTDDVCIPK